MATKKDAAPSSIDIQIIETQTISVAVVGVSPLIMNRMSEKVRQILLLGAGKKTSAEKQANLKHNPLEEYRASAYVLRSGDTLLGILSTAFKGAMRSASIDSGAKAAQIGRLVYVEGDYTPIYGIPYMFMAVTRSADFNHTPDIRTRAILPEWAAVVHVTFAVPLLNITSIINLLAADGQIIGVGDGRPEKGKMTFGRYRIVNADDPDFIRIKESGGRVAQQAALNEPSFYDEDTESLYTWYTQEIIRRGKG